MRSNIRHFFSKVICIGEVHGIDECTEFQLELIESFLIEKKKLIVLIERDFEEQSFIDEWLSTQKAPKEFEKFFKFPVVSNYLNHQFSFLEKLSRLFNKYNDLNIHCIDMSFKKDTQDSLSSDIQNISNEDEFDFKREEFIISRLKSLTKSLGSADKILWIAGNMHVSKTARYYSLTEKSSNHIKTSAMWLNERFGCESIYTLPFSGDYAYQKKNKVVNHKICVTSDEFKHLTQGPFSGLRKAKSLDVSDFFKESYDWVFGIQDSTPSSVRKKN